MEDMELENMEAGSDGDGAAWMTTFADLMSLLLTFFVLLLSFAQMDIVKFRDALGSIQNAFGYADSSQGYNPTRSTSMIEQTYEKKDTMMEQPFEMKFKKVIVNETVTAEVSENKEVLESISEAIDKNNLEEVAQVMSTGKGVMVRVTGNMMFDSGSDVLKEEARPLIDEIIGIIEKYPYNVSVEGHTDNTPISTAQFRSNWELSSARAIAVLRYVMDSGRIATDRLGASGYADTRPIESNETPEGRQHNRRVEFNFYKE